MKTGWQTKPLADVCEIKPPKSEARERIATGALVSFAPMEDLGIDRKFLNASQVKPLASVVGSYTYFADGDVLLAKITPCFENGKLGIAAGLSNGIGFGSSEFVVFRPCANLDKEFLYYYLSRADFRSEGAARMGGAVGQQRVPKEFVESYPIPVPPLPEQRRIVGILDKAFEGIATAKANAEKNLQNARALFESHLQSVFTQRGEGWVEKPFSELCDLISGQHIDAADYNTEKKGIGYLTGPSDFGFLYPVVTKWTEHPKRTALKDDLLVTVKGAGVGKLNILKENEVAISRQLMAVRTNGTDVRFLYAFLSTQLAHFQSLSKGATIPGISREDILDLPCPIPPTRQEQHTVVAKLYALSEETQRLESIYRRKLVALEALKKSLLHQAFSGEL